MRAGCGAAGSPGCAPAGLRFLPPVPSLAGNLLWQERLCGLFLFAAVCRLSVFRQTTLSHFEIMNLKWNLIFLYLLWILLLCLLKCDVLHCLFFLHFLVESALK